MIPNSYSQGRASSTADTGPLPNNSANFKDGQAEASVRPVFVVELRPERHVADPARALRRALKALLRRFGLRALSVEERKP
jgi:hypothetical protein